MTMNAVSISQLACFLSAILAVSNSVSAFVIVPSSRSSITSLFAASIADSSQWQQQQHARQATQAPKRQVPLSFDNLPSLPAVPEHAVPQITELDGHVDLVDFIEGQDDGRLAMILFHASWCKSCQRTTEYYKRLARSQADAIDESTGKVVRPGTVRLARLEWGRHTSLCRSLGIRKLPTIHFFKAGGMVEGFACGPTNFAQNVPPTIRKLQFEDTLDQGLAMIEDVVAKQQRATTNEKATS